VSGKSLFIGLLLTISLPAGCGLLTPATPQATETYTVAIAGVITAQPSLSATTYTIAGHPGDTHLDGAGTSATVRGDGMTGAK
jgi:hypothetical protein